MTRKIYGAVFDILSNCVHIYLEWKPSALFRCYCTCRDLTDRTGVGATAVGLCNHSDIVRLPTSKCRDYAGRGGGVTHQSPVSGFCLSIVDLCSFTRLPANLNITCLTV